MATRSSSPMELQHEMSRVFTGAIVNRVDNETCRVLVSGWPDSVLYHTRRAVMILRGFEDGAGSTEHGDAMVCRAIEQAGASLGTSNTKD